MFNFGLHTQVSDSGPHGPLVLDKLVTERKYNLDLEFSSISAQFKGVPNFICFVKLLDWFNPIAFKKAKIAYNFGLSECKRVKSKLIRMFLV